MGELDPRSDRTEVWLAHGITFPARRLSERPSWRRLPAPLRRLIVRRDVRLTAWGMHQVQIAVPTDEPAHWQVALYRRSGRLWREVSYQSRAEAAVMPPAGRIGARWTLAPAAPLSPDDRHLDVLVHANIGPAGSPEEPPVAEVIETDRAIMVTFTYRPPPNPAGDGEPIYYALVEWHPMPVTVELREPLGDRVLLDGPFWPAQPVPLSSAPP